MITPAKGIAKRATLDSSIFTSLERPALSCIGFADAVHLAVQGLAISAQITCMLGYLRL
jgi:hypothetical protein